MVVCREGGEEVALGSFSSFYLASMLFTCFFHIHYIIDDSGDLRGVAGGDGELGCLCGKAGTSHLCDGSAHSSGCVVNGSNAMAAV